MGVERLRVGVVQTGHVLAWRRERGRRLSNVFDIVWSRVDGATGSRNRRTALGLLGGGCCYGIKKGVRWAGRQAGSRQAGRQATEGKSATDEQNKATRGLRFDFRVFDGGQDKRLQTSGYHISTGQTSRFYWVFRAQM